MTASVWRRVSLSVAVVLLAVSCGGGSATSTTVPPTSTTSSTTTTAASGVTATTVGADTTTTAASGVIAIEGSEDFTAQVRAALDLLETAAPDVYAQVTTVIATFQSVASGSGMVVEDKTFLIGDETAFSAGATAENQVKWLAGAIAHDSCHSARYIQGLEHVGRDAELACLEYQRAALIEIGAIDGAVAYITYLIDGVDDPANQYWTDPNRHW